MLELILIYLGLGTIAALFFVALASVGNREELQPKPPERRRDTQFLA